MTSTRKTTEEVTMISKHLLTLFYALLWSKSTGTCAFSFSARYNSVYSSITTNRFLGLQQRKIFNLLYLQNKDDDIGDSPNKNENSDKKDEVDWRDFRAKLVMSEKKGEEVQVPSLDATNTNDDGQGNEVAPKEWAYDSGPMIETGSVILCKPRIDLGYGLRQQYFHKAVVLVLDHDENFFTKGIILNRPSNRVLENDASPRGSEKWRVWFGGEVQGMNSDDEEIICIHSLSSDAIDRVSHLVMKDIKYTAFEDAKELVRLGEAQPSDFWVFSGYAGWGKGQLMQEVAQDTWIMVTTDSNTILKELAKQQLPVGSQDAGLDTWKNVMNLVASGSAESTPTVIFDDLMLKEWVRQRLFSSSTSSSFTPAFTDEKENLRGLLLRASSEYCSPFLLQDQSMHKGLFLVTMDTERYSVAVSLNHPTTRVVDIPVPVKHMDFTMDVPFIQRYGGQYTIYGEGEVPLLWLHCSEKLRKAKIGTPICSSGEGIWECTAKQVADAVHNYLAAPTEFMAISGGFVWEKTDGGQAGGIRGEIWDGKYEPVSPTLTDEVWSTLISQDLLSTTNIDKNIGIGIQAWDIAGGQNTGKDDKGDVPVVPGSSVAVSTLSDTALRKWIAAYILNAPGLQDDLSEGKRE